MGEQESWLGRRFADLSEEERRAFLADHGEPIRDYHGLDPAPEGPHRDYEPLHPRGGTDWRRLLQRIWAPIAALIGLALKFGFLFLKFFSIFISVAAYALIWGWKFATGFVLIILVHEMGHFVEAKRQGLHVTLPTFVPFIGAFVLIKNSPLNPWKNALVALAGPAAGGVACVVCWAVAGATGSDLLQALAYAGFLINLINLAPIGILDGGTIWQSIKLARNSLPAAPGEELALGSTYPLTVPGGGRDRALQITILYALLATLLVLGMIATHVSQTRL
jgi:Zn-dependent protease